MMRHGLLKAIVAATVLALLPARAIAADKTAPLFAGDEMIHVTLSGPLGHMSRSATAKPVAGSLKLDAAAPETLPVTLTTRGVTRRLVQVCSFPPLRVAFTAKPGAASLFKGQKRLKLVTHCMESEKYEQDVLLEYAAYRLYNALTPESFRVRLARVDYVLDDGDKLTTRYGFFIEDIDDMAARNAQQRLRGVPRISAGQIDRQAASRFAVFQYMISNLDWAMTLASPGEEDCCHNSRLVGPKGAATGLTTVPYDFDYSGLVMRLTPFRRTVPAFKMSASGVIGDFAAITIRLLPSPPRWRLGAPSFWPSWTPCPA